jgi:TonB family protein
LFEVVRGKAFASWPHGPKGFVSLPAPSADVYTPDEIARAAGVSPEAVIAEIGRADALVPFARAVQIGRALARRATRSGSPRPLFSTVRSNRGWTGPRTLPLAVSSTLHLAALAVFSVTLGLTSRAETLRVSDSSAEHLRLVFLTVPGPGGGGGGGGLQQKAPPPKAMRAGQNRLSSPLPRREPPPPIVPAPTRPEPPPRTLDAERLPPIVAPVLASPADAQDRRGLLDQSRASADSNGSGREGGVGTGTGTGLGEGSGSGIGPGTGGGTGGGPYRPGSGITPPRLLHEVKADYTESARRRGIEGEVVLEIVVRSDGSVSDVKVVRGLESSLNDRAAQAVRQWRFAPALRQGVAIDVIVEAAVEFKLR